MQELNRETVTERKTPWRAASPFLFQTLLIGGAFLLGICWSAGINNAELGVILTHFKAVWSLASNRPLIFRLIFTMLFTGIVFAALVGACVYAWNWVKPRKADSSLQEEAQEVPLLLPQQDQFIPQERNEAVHDAVQEDEIHSPTTTQIASPETPIPPFAEAALLAPLHQNISASTTGIARSVERVNAPSSPDEHSREKSPSLEITLLGNLSMTLHIPGTDPGTYRTYPVRVEDLNTKHQQLIAYVAWPQGGTVTQGKMRDSIYGTDEADPEQVQQGLNTGKKEVRRRIAAAVTRAKRDGGVIPSDLDLFEVDIKSYRLNPYCRVTDLTRVDAQYAIIEQAVQTHQLISHIPASVYNACMALIHAYTGNFLEEVLVNCSDTLDDWTESWARKPFTVYKHRYLQALFYAGEHLRKLGDRTTDDVLRQQEYYHDAATLFARGAMAACDDRVFEGLFDLYVSFSRSGIEESPHVSFGEQMVRRAVACYGKIGNTTLADSTYTKYTQQMTRVSQGIWTPQVETKKDIAMVREKTGAYRFPDRIGSPFRLGSPLISTESA